MSYDPQRYDCMSDVCGLTSKVLKIDTISHLSYDNFCNNKAKLLIPYIFPCAS